MLEIVNVPELYSSGDSVPDLAFPTSSFQFSPSSNTSRSLAYFNTGVISPPSIATAMAMLISLLKNVPSGLKELFTMGCFSMALATALARRAETVTPLGLTCWYKALKASISISRLARNTGQSRVATMLLETARCIPVKGTRPSGNSTGAGAPGAATLLLGFISPVAILTSSAVTRPNSPVPSIEARSNLAFLAKARAVGVAATTPSAGCHLGLVGAAAAFFAGAPPEAAFVTSPAVIRPPGPLPATVDKSTPISSAIFFARGEATTRPPADAALGAAAAFGAAALGAAAAGAAAAGAAAAGAPPRVAAYALSAGISASLAAISATGVPTAALSPSSVMIAAMNPSSNASTSISALSDSTTIIASPASTASPSPFNQDTTLPSFIVDESAGISSWLKSKSGAAAAAGASAAGAGAASSAAGAGAASPPAATASISASSAAISATTAPTSAVSPSSVIILAKNPSSNASTSMSALSDSTTMIASPASIASPSDFSQETTRPSFIVEERAGMVIFIASAFKAVSKRIALVMSLLDGKRCVKVLVGTLGATNADTALFCTAPCQDTRQRRAVVLEIPAMNFIINQ
mmetsp:Transcript_6397/g.10394  ORF Transcript_6397/g.10394 Transcript_6397/m.10394 type:complete len:582 (-) Transcript_6397:116-1861(-)